jgi:hypothetical protein
MIMQSEKVTKCLELIAILDKIVGDTPLVKINDVHEAILQAYNFGVDDAIENLTYVWDEIYDQQGIDLNKLHDLKIK